VSRVVQTRPRSQTATLDSHSQKHIIIQNYMQLSMPAPIFFTILILFSRLWLSRTRFVRGRFRGCFRFSGSFLGSLLCRGFTVSHAISIVRHLEGCISYLLTDSTGPNTLGTNANGLGRAVCRRCPNILQIRQKRSSRDACNLCPNSTKILRLTSRLDVISETSPFSANLTDPCHSNTPKTFTRF
jgi:hypothetical protein